MALHGGPFSPCPSCNFLEAQHISLAQWLRNEMSTAKLSSCEILGLQEARSRRVQEMWSSVASSRVWKQWNCSLLGEPLCQCWHHYHGLINEYLQHFDVVLILLILSACRQDRSIWDFVLLQDADPHTIREAWMSELVDYMCYFEIWWFWSKMSHSRNVEKCFVLQRQAYLRLVRNHHPDSRQRCSEGYEEFLGTEGWQTIGKTYKSAQSDVGLGRELKLCKKDVFSSAWKLSCYYQSPKSQVFECISLGWLHDSPCKMWLKSFDGLAVSQLFLWTSEVLQIVCPLANQQSRNV